MLTRGPSLNLFLFFALSYLLQRRNGVIKIPGKKVRAARGRTCWNKGDNGRQWPLYQRGNWHDKWTQSQRNVWIENWKFKISSMAKTVAKFNSYIIKYASLTECLWWKLLDCPNDIWNDTFIRFLWNNWDTKCALIGQKAIIYLICVPVTDTCFPLAALKMPEL